MNKRGATLIEVLIASVAIAIAGAAAYRSFLAIQTANNRLTRKADAERQIDLLLARISKVINTRAAVDVPQMPKPIKGTGAYGARGGVFPIDSASCPNPLVAGTSESAACQDLKIFQTKSSGGYRETSFLTSCVQDDAGQGTDNLPHVIAPFSAVGSSTEGLQLCKKSDQSNLAQLPRFQIVTVPDTSAPTTGVVTENYPDINVAGVSGGDIRGVAVCFRVCHPLTVDPAAYQPPETILIQMAAIYRTGDLTTEKKPKYEVVTRQKVLSFVGQSPSIEILPP